MDLLDLPNDARAAGEEDLSRLLAEWPPGLPPDHLGFLQRCDGYDGPLRRPDGSVARSQIRIFDVATILRERAWFVTDHEVSDLLPIGGMDSWRYCLRAVPDGSQHYIDYEPGSGEILATYAASLEELLHDLVREADAAP